MGRFQFRLEKLRRLREIARDERRTRLAEAYRAEQILAERRESVDAELAAARAEQRDVVATGDVDVNRLLEAGRYQLALESQQAAISSQASTLADEVEKRRSEALASDREVRLLDRLEERQLAEHRRCEQSAEAKKLDEIAARRFGGLA